MKRDQEIVTLFLLGYNRLTGSAFQVAEWCDEVERQRAAVEAIARNPQGRTLAIEHTLTQPFSGEREDTQAFRTVFGQLELDSRFHVPGYDIELWPPVGAIPKGTNWQRIAIDLGQWFLSSARQFPNGDSIQNVHGLGFDLQIPVTKEPHPQGAVFVGRSGMPDTFGQVVDRALERKLPKLLATEADERILILEKARTPRGYVEVTKAIDKLKSKFLKIVALNEVWVVNTIEWDKSASLWFLKVWPNGVGARFTLWAKPGEPESATYVRGSGEEFLWRQFCGREPFGNVI